MQDTKVMVIIKCTAKLLRELRTKPAIEPNQSPGLWQWHANLLRIERTNCVLFTNDWTLYSFLVIMKKRPQQADFAEMFRLGLFKSLMNEGLAEPRIKYILSDHGHVVIANTSSRSVLGSMNDLAFQITSMIQAKGGLAVADLTEINRNLNRVPMKAIKYQFSIDELMRASSLRPDPNPP
jgi:hypothetical protein